MQDDVTMPASRARLAAEAQAVRTSAAPARPQADPVARRETRGRLGVIASIAICGAIGAFLVNQYATLVANNYRLQAMEAQATQQQAVNASLESTVYQLSAPTRILAIAEGKLKMQPATPVTVASSGR